MLSRVRDYDPAAGVLPNERWSGPSAVSTVGRVAGGEDAERRSFRRRLGVTLARVRQRLTTMKQSDVAELLGVDVETVGRWERGEREPKAFELHRLAEKYAVPGDWFLFPTDSVTELDLRIETARASATAAAAAALAHEDLAAEEARHRATEAREAARRHRRPA